MVRRWSYLSNSITNIKLSTVYFKKSFKSTVRFKRFSVKLTKLTRKKFNSRKIINSHYNLMIYAFKWAKVYKLIMKNNKLLQINNFFARKSLLAQSSKQSWSNLIAGSKKLHVAFSSLRLNPNYHMKHLFFDSYFLYIRFSGGKVIFPKLNSVIMLYYYLNSIRRLITLATLKLIM